jgi:hypothetical protein
VTALGRALTGRTNTITRNTISGQLRSLPASLPLPSSRTLYGTREAEVGSPSNIALLAPSKNAIMLTMTNDVNAPRRDFLSDQT